MKLVFGTINVVARFDSYRKGLRKDMIYSITRKKIFGLVDKGKENPISGTLRDNPYSKGLMETAGNAGGVELVQRT